MGMNSSDYKIIADYHTHTDYSHGRGTVRENVERARQLGLKRIAITDHGTGHVIFGISKREMYWQLEEIEQLRKEFNDIEILSGVEGNMKGLSGKCDIDKQMYDALDVLLCGFHVSVIPEKLSDSKLFFNGWVSHVYKPSKSEIARNTSAYINLIKNNKIDIVTHINFHLSVDCKEVAKCCADYGTALEISSRHSDCTEQDYEDMFGVENVLFSVNSDAHKVENIANCQKALEVLARYDVPSYRVINCEGCNFEFRSRG